MADLWRFTLPIPPSVNAAYNPVNFRGKTVMLPDASLSAFKRVAAKMLMVQRRPREPLDGKIAVTVAVARQKGDLDNRLKAAIDAIVKAGIIRDDSCVETIEARWDDAIKDCAITVEVMTPFAIRKSLRSVAIDYAKDRAVELAAAHDISLPDLFRQRNPVPMEMLVKQRQLLKAMKDEGLRSKAIAEAIGITPEKVRSILSGSHVARRLARRGLPG